VGFAKAKAFALGKAAGLRYDGNVLAGGCASERPAWRGNMPISPDLLEILCCPRTKVPVVMLPEDRRALLNQRIEQRQVKYFGGETVDKPLTEGLITEDGQTIYRIDDDIPVMLVDQGSPTEQLK
jgi:uncharacterized protein YbaR (Trm112 family)